MRIRPVVWALLALVLVLGATLVAAKVVGAVVGGIGLALLVVAFLAWVLGIIPTSKQVDAECGVER